jgi:hypothetical protein
VAEGWLDSRKHLGCLELGRSCVVQTAAMSLKFSAHDKATVDAGIPVSKSWSWRKTVTEQG